MARKDMSELKLVENQDIKTMTSVEMLPMSGYESISALHKALRNKFPDAIGDSVLESAHNPNGAVACYTLT